MKGAISSPPTNTPPPQKQYSPSGRRQDLKGCTHVPPSLARSNIQAFLLPIPPTDYLLSMGYNSHIAAFIFNVVTNLVPVKEPGYLARGFDNVLH
jgi:hypothetical protein